jgi:protein-S-isoprenylcysteine O-methyltransferase Ste14
MLTARIAFCLLAVVCFVSFAWAIGKHFIKVDERTPKLMRVLSVLGLVFTALQLFAIVITDKFNFVSSIIGAVLYLASLALFWWAVSTTRSSRLSLAFSSDEPRYLLRSGPYKFIRHPFYSAYTLFWLAGVVTTLVWWLTIPVVIVCVFYVRAARMEEIKFLNSDLDLDYRNYCKSTGMFFPKI